MKKTDQRTKLNEVFPDWVDGLGIFSYLADYNVPWGETFGEGDLTLDILYHGSYSGDKIVSPFVRKMVSATEATAEEAGRLAGAIFGMFSTSWNKEWATLSAQYNPIENYSMVEQMTGDTTQDTFGHTNTRTLANSHTKTGTEALSESVTGTRTDNLTDERTIDGTQTKSGTVGVDEDSTDTRTDNLTDTQTLNLSHAKTGSETQTPNVTLTEQENTFGFNTVAVDGEPTRKKTQTSTGTQQTTYNTTDTDTGTDTTTHTGTSETERDASTTTTYDTTDTEDTTDTTTHTGTQQNSTSGTHTTTHNTTEADTGTITDAESGSNTRRRDYHLTRSGNIGVTTSQQMLQSERDLWVWNFLRDVVFPDVDYLLTIPVY